MTFGAFTQVSTTPEHELGAFVTPARSLYFASGTDAFGAPMLVPNIFPGGEDRPVFLSNDGCRLYLFRQGVGLYVATQPPN